MKKITKLTQAQKDRLPEIAKEWIEYIRLFGNSGVEIMDANDGFIAVYGVSATEQYVGPDDSFDVESPKGSIVARIEREPDKPTRYYISTDKPVIHRIDALSA